MCAKFGVFAFQNMEHRCTENNNKYCLHKGQINEKQFERELSAEANQVREKREKSMNAFQARGLTDISND